MPNTGTGTPVPNDLPPAFMYLHAKAEQYLETGLGEYRKADFFGMPPDSLSREELQLLESGMKQIIAFRGWSSDRPFEGLGISGLNTLLAVLHFGPVSQEIHEIGYTWILDKVRFQHSITSKTLVLFNRVDMQEVD